MAGGIHASSPGSTAVNRQMGHSVLVPDYSIDSHSTIGNSVSIDEVSNNSVEIDALEGNTSRKRKLSADVTNHQLESKRTCISSQLLSDMIIEKEKYLYLWLLREYSGNKENDFFNFINKIDYSNLLPISNPLQPKSFYFASEPECFRKSIPSEIVSVLKHVQITKQESHDDFHSLGDNDIHTKPSIDGDEQVSTLKPSNFVDNTQVLAEKAKQEAHILQRISELQKLGLWTEKRLPKVQEPPRAKAHWDYVLEELVWLATDFAQERKWKKAAARKRSRMIQKHFQEREAQVQKTAKAAETHKRKIASHLAKMVKTFWNEIEKLVEYKHQTKLKEKRQQALDQHLSFIVDKTEKYSTLVAESMNKSNNLDSQPHSPLSDADFEPNQSSSDDEETIEAEEKGDVADNVDHMREVEMLKRESQLSLDDILQQLPQEYKKQAGLASVDKDDEIEAEMDDDEYDVEIDDSDDETTLMEEEKIQGAIDYKSEIAELKADNDLSIEELKIKYAVRIESNHDFPDSSESDSSSEYEDSDESSDIENTDDEMSLAEEEEDEEDGDGLRSLLHENGDVNDRRNDDEKINNVAAIAESIQPKGNTLSSTCVVTKVPFLLKHSLREYQHIGLDWLVTMYERRLNGILADEMGLGKTIQTISLLAHLASDKEIWGPHLIVVPTSVMLNWEMEFKKWCPAFKILTYYGNPKERKLKRKGWTKPNTFHVCITSYKLVLQDHHSFRRKKWLYLILDEAQNIKNFKSQRWQRLLNFDSERRLLLTGTPLQNNLMELWSLMHFLMPNLFPSIREFKEGFCNPVTGMIEGNAEYDETIIKRLHKVLRPFLLRRLKNEVEKQLPRKYEHICMCRLSNRQRYLYDDFMSRAKTKETLSTGNLLSVINVLMQLRKVCNHPNLFEPRPIISPFQMDSIRYQTPSLVYNALDYNPFRHVGLDSLNLRLVDAESELTAWSVYRLNKFRVPRLLIEEITETPSEPPPIPKGKLNIRLKTPSDLNNIRVDSNVRNNNKIVTFLKSASSTSLIASSSARSFGTSGAPIKPGPIHRTILGLGEINNMAVKRFNINATDIVSNRTVYSSLPAKVTLLKAVSVKNSQITDKSHVSVINSTNSTSNAFASSSSTAHLVQTKLNQKIVSPSSISIEKNQSTIFKPQNNNLHNVARNPNISVINSTNVTASSSTLLLNNSARNTSIAIPKPISIPSANTLPHNTTNASNSTTSRSKSEKLKMRLLPECNKMLERRKQERKKRLQSLANMNERKTSPNVMFGCDVRSTLQMLDTNVVCPPVEDSHHWKCAGHANCINAQYAKHVHSLCYTMTNALANSVKSIEERIQELSETFSRFIVYVPAVHARRPVLKVAHPNPSKAWSLTYMECTLEEKLVPKCSSLHQIVSRMNTSFPDGRLIQYDCGKLQTLDTLLRRLKMEQHRVLIFTQMARMLDVLEAFLTFHGHIYLRLDGSTRIDQRQVLMERFNADKRYFCFILSTRSGGIGVNLTGADTVIFYDSDWNPTMDAQAQDRCHRIGQTRDVHIYRLISEKTIEENILKKANQKKLLGDLAIEGGNFTTAYFKSSTIHDLFNIDHHETDPAKRISDVMSDLGSQNIEKSKLNAYENALAAAEDEPDVAAANTAKEEAVADLAEFDENIPLDNDGNDANPTEEISKADLEVNALLDELRPVERWALNFMETVDAEWAEEQLAAAEAEIELQKKEWEMERLAIEQADVKSKRFDDADEDDNLLTFSSEDARNQKWISFDSIDILPMWLPFASFVKNGGEEEIHIDRSLKYLYETVTIPEHLLPPVYYRKERKKLRLDHTGSDFIKSPIRIRNRYRESLSCATFSVAALEPPRSLFDRPSPLVAKLRQDMRLQKYRGLARSTVSNLPSTKPYFPSRSSDPDFVPDWLIHEDYALLQAIQHLQELPLNLSILYPAHMPNWDLVSDLVNQVSGIYRSPIQCRNRFETSILPREEGKISSDTISKKHKKIKGISQILSHSTTKFTRNYKTAQLYLQDGNNVYTQMMNTRFDAIRAVSNRRAPTIKRLPLTTSTKNPKHAQILAECEIDYDRPLTPIEIASKRAQRIAKEKASSSAEQILLRQNTQRQQQQLQQSDQQTQVSNQQQSTVQQVSQQQSQAAQTQQSLMVTQHTQLQATQLQQPVILQQVQSPITSHRTSQVPTSGIVPQQTAVVVSISQSPAVSPASVAIRSLVTRPVNDVLQQQSSVVIPNSKASTGTSGNFISTGSIQRLIPITQIQSTSVGSVGTARILNATTKTTPNVQNVQIYRQQQQTLPQHQLKILHPRSKTPVGVVVTSPQRQQLSPQPSQPQQQPRPIIKSTIGSGTTPTTSARLSEADLTAIIRRQQQLQQQQQHQQKMVSSMIATSTAAVAVTTVTTSTSVVQAQIIAATQAGSGTTKIPTGVTLPALKPTTTTALPSVKTSPTTPSQIRQITIQPTQGSRKLQRVMLNATNAQNISHVLATKNTQGNVTTTPTQIMGARVIPVNKTIQVVNAAALRSAGSPNVAIETPSGTRYIQQGLSQNAIRLSGSPSVSVNALSPQQHSFNQLVQNQSLVRQGNLIIQNTGIVSATIAPTSTSAASSPTHIVSIPTTQFQMSTSEKKSQ